MVYLCPSILQGYFKACRAEIYSYINMVLIHPDRHRLSACLSYLCIVSRKNNRTNRCKQKHRNLGQTCPIYKIRKPYTFTENHRFSGFGRGLVARIWLRSQNHRFCPLRTSFLTCRDELDLGDEAGFGNLLIFTPLLILVGTLFGPP